MNTTVTIESKNHKYQHTFGGVIARNAYSHPYTISEIDEFLIRDMAFNKSCEAWSKQRDSRKNHDNEN